MQHVEYFNIINCMFTPTYSVDLIYIGDTEYTSISFVLKSSVFVKINLSLLVLSLKDLGKLMYEPLLTFEAEQTQISPEPNMQQHPLDNKIAWIVSMTGN